MIFENVQANVTRYAQRHCRRATRALTKPLVLAHFITFYSSQILIVAISNSSQVKGVSPDLYIQYIIARQALELSMSFNLVFISLAGLHHYQDIDRHLQLRHCLQWY